MAEENTPAPTPKEAAMNLVKSLRTPLIWFGIGFVSCFIWQQRRKRTPAA